MSKARHKTAPQPPRLPEKTEYISLPDSVTTRLLRGQSNANFDRLQTMFEVRIKATGTEQDPSRYAISGNVEDVGLVALIIKGGFYDAVKLAEENEITDKHAIKDSDYSKLKKILDGLVPAFYARRGQQQWLQDALETVSQQASGQAVQHMRNAIGIVPTTPEKLVVPQPFSRELPAPFIPTARLKGLNIAVFSARNPSSAILYTSLTDEQNRVAAGIGSPGGGKSFSQQHWAFNEVAQGRKKAVRILRPRETTGREEFGAVRGGVDKKMLPYMGATANNLQKITGESLDQLQDRKVLILDTGDFSRGDTFDDEILLIDDAGGFTVGTIKAITTRMGSNTRLIYNGDLSQHQNDLGNTQSGLVYLVKPLYP